MKAGRRAAAQARASAVVERPRAWVAAGDDASRRVVAVSWWRRYRDIDGPLQSLLLTIYVFLTVLPSILVLAEYLERNPAALANHLVKRYHLTGSAAGMLRGVLVGDHQHELGSALFAIAATMIFGVGFGRVLQPRLCTSVGAELKDRLTDQLRFAAVLLVLFGLITLLLVQEAAIAGNPPWASPALAPAWIAALVGYFIWAPRYLTHGRIAARDLVASAGIDSARDRRPHVRLERRNGAVDRFVCDRLLGARRLHGALLLARAQLVRDRPVRKPSPVLANRRSYLTGPRAGDDETA